MSGQRCGVETFSSSVCFPGSLGPTFTHKGQKTWWGFPSDSGKSGTTSTYFFPVLVPVDATVETFPLLQSCYQKPSNQFFFFAASLPFVYSVSLPLKSMWIAPLKFPRGPVDMLSPRWGRPVHTQVPWWCTMCLRCFRPRPLSLKSVTRCCDVSTRALAIAIPGNPERKEREILSVYIFSFKPSKGFQFY